MSHAVAQRLAGLEEVEIEIEKLVAGGEGFGRFEGIPLFVPRAAPGDRLRVRIVERRQDYGRAEILEILAPGTGRREPPCPHFARCGGCDLQHLDDGTQLRAKAEATLETLRRLGGLEPPEILRVVSGAPWAYRLRAQIHLERGADGVVRAGYHARRSNELVAVDSCPILVPELEEVLRQLPRTLAAAAVVPRRIDLACGGAAPGAEAAVTVAPALAELPHGAVSITVSGLEFEFDARSFFQGHRELLTLLVDRVVGDFSGDEALDLYCGVGLFALPLARRYRHVLGVESEVGAVRYARRNARRNGLAHVDIEACSVEGWIRRLAVDLDRVVVDPPRAGLPLTVRRILLDRAPKRLTYVSCHAAALARDLRELRQAYAVESLDLVDLFPQTGHLEVIMQLRRKDHGSESGAVAAEVST